MGVAVTGYNGYAFSDNRGHGRQILLPRMLPVQMMPSGVLSSEVKTFDVRQFGAQGDGRALDTAAINRAVAACAQAGGGVVRFSAGRYLSGTVHLKSNVTLALDAEATLVGTADLDQYQHFQPSGEPESRWLRWHRALVLADGAENVCITGPGTIDGANVFDPRGEEKMRGPHAVLLGHCRGAVIRNVAIRDAANYAILFEGTDRVEIRGVRVTGGYDGIHFRGWPGRPCRDVLIADCVLQTGDDCIAGRYWHNTRITGCTLNSSCNCVRLIGPATGLVIEKCRLEGPGLFPHRTSKRRATLAGLNLQPGAWDPTRGVLDEVRITDVTMHNVSAAFHFTLKPGNSAGRILVERVSAAGVYLAASSVESWAEAPFDHVEFRDIEIEFVGGGTEDQASRPVKPPATEARPLPAWGFYLRHVKQATLENARFRLAKEDRRPVVAAEQVDNLVLKGVSFPPIAGVEPLRLRSVKHVEKRELL